MEIEGPEAQFHRESQRRSTDVAAEPQRPETNIAENIRRCINMTTDENAEAWWQLIYWLTCEPNRAHQRLYNSGLDSFWGWENLDPTNHARMERAAESYLHHADMPIVEWWTKPGSDDWRSIAGYRALEMLLQFRPTMLSALPPEVWAKWAPTIIRTHMNDEGKVGYGARLMALCHAEIPEVVRERLQERFSLMLDAHGGDVAIHETLKGLWDNEIGALIGDLLARPALSPSRLAEGMMLLLEHEHPAALPLLQAALEGRGEGERRIALLAAALREGKFRRWHDIWPKISQDEALGGAVLTRAFELNVASGQLLDGLATLSAEDHADLFLFLWRVTSGQPVERVFTGNPLPSVRGELLTALVYRGTEQACRALARIRDALPDQEWLPSVVLRCRENLRRNAWLPANPAGLIALAATRDKRWVRSADDLLDVIVESLERYQEHLRGPQLPLGALWNTVKGQFRPKEENEISDRITEFLRQDLKGRGIITNREVELKPARGGARGERTDIAVEAVNPNDPADTISVIVEVKGCWHTEVQTAMESQLVARYLTDSGNSHGLYLVGWFLCPAWMQEDGRRQDAERRLPDLEKARGCFQSQAKSLSRNGPRVRAVVLDAQWPADDKKPAPSTQRKRRQKA